MQETNGTAADGGTASDGGKASGGGKRGALVAAIALVAVVALGAVGYGVLSSSGAGSGGSGGVGSAPAAQGTSGGTASGGNAGGAAGGAPATQGRASLLKDYDATVYAASGEKTTLTAIAAGRPLVINFWATWCPYCVQEMPDYLEIYRDYGDRVSFAFVDCPGGRGETPQKATSWLSENGFSELPAYFDNDLEATSAFGARSLPTTVVVAANGEIVGVTPGRIDAGRLRSALDSLV